MNRVGVIGAGTMGHGIAQVAGMAGYEVVLTDANPDVLAAGIKRIADNLKKGVARGKLDETLCDQTLAQIHVGTTTDVAQCDLIIEAVPERHDLKVAVFQEIERTCSATAILATNTSSLSVSAIAAELKHPEQVIGLHFFNPVHIMKLLEVILAEQTEPSVLDRVQVFGERIGKELITVRDAPGFATSRLGVCLGMEAIRMVEQNVASPEDIDKAMVLGYRHPIGPLRLTDLVGLDVRMHIGAYLAKALSNPAFEPPDLMREMVAAGKLGKKAGEGFYSW